MAPRRQGGTRILSGNVVRIDRGWLLINIDGAGSDVVLVSHASLLVLFSTLISRLFGLSSFRFLAPRYNLHCASSEFDNSISHGTRVGVFVQECSIVLPSALLPEFT